MSDSENKGQLTRLLRASSAGDAGARNQLIETVYSDLRRLAASVMRSERSSHTLQPTALVNEWMMKVLSDNADLRAENREHFMSTAARAMRHLLIDHARGKATRKRGGGADVFSLQSDFDAGVVSQEKLLLIHDAMSRLESLNERQAKVAELRIFGGFSILEIAEALNVTARTVDRDWLLAKVWLQSNLK